MSRKYIQLSSSDTKICKNTQIDRARKFHGTRVFFLKHRFDMCSFTCPDNRKSWGHLVTMLQNLQVTGVTIAEMVRNSGLESDI